MTLVAFRINDSDIYDYKKWYQSNQSYSIITIKKCVLHNNTVTAGKLITL